MERVRPPVDAPDRLEVVFGDDLAVAAPAAGRAEQAGQAAEPQPSTGTIADGRAWSPDIQALRALAVMLVVIFHFWPGALPGGYIGVDVFFVISGFLISGHLLRDLERGRFSIPQFYARRARRLLPISLLVLGLTMIFVVRFQPTLDWEATAQQVLASAGYAQNWVLAAQHVDYLNPEFAPTAVQHFWSLSVEEQFYLVWPAALLLASLATRGNQRARRIAITSLMGVALLASLGYAIQATSAGVDGFYFYSTGRIWQFAAGGLLAAAVTYHPAQLSRLSASNELSTLLSLTGFGAILYAGFTLTADSPVPGTAALIPVLGTVLALAAGRGARTQPTQPSPLTAWIRARPVQWLGDVSYSLYLWHWPVLLLAPTLLGVVPGSGQTLGDVRRIALLLVCLLLAGLSKPLIEDRFRAPGRPAAIAIVAGLLVVVSVAALTWRDTSQRGPAAEVLATTALARHTPCFGAAAMLDADRCTTAPFADRVTPDPTFALDSFAETKDWHGCFVMSGSKRIQSCDFGPADAVVHIALFGDSHAMAALPMLQQAASAAGWRITTYLRASCPPNVAVPVRPTVKETGRCRAWVDDAITRINADPSVTTVITTTYNIRQWVTPEPGQDSYAVGVAGYQRTWRRLSARGARQVVVLKDVPHSDDGMLPCVARSHHGGEGCSTSQTVVTTARGAWQDRPDPIVAAAQTAIPQVPVLDLTDAFCTQGRCPAVIGNVLVHADLSHITPTFARTLGPEFGRRLQALVD